MAGDLRLAAGDLRLAAGDHELEARDLSLEFRAFVFRGCGPADGTSAFAERICRLPAEGGNLRLEPGELVVGDAVCV